MPPFQPTGGYGSPVLNPDATTTIQVEDGVTSGQKLTIAQFHNSDDQVLPTTAFGLLAGGVAQGINPAGNLDRQRTTGADQVASAGIFTGAMQFAQEIQATCTTTVASGSGSWTAGGTPATVTLSVATTTNFLAGGTLSFEPGTVRYESAKIKSIVANTSVTVEFPPAGAQFTHTANYTVQTFIYNQERDFNGEGPNAQGIGAAIATEFESNNGGPPLTSGLASGQTLDADRNFQGKNNTQMAITSTTAGNTSVVFTNNPWTSGLIIGQALLLSSTATGSVVEEVIVSKLNVPVTGAGPITVTLVNPVVNSGSAFAMFDIFGAGGPGTGGSTLVGVSDEIIQLYDSNAADPKKPLFPLARARNTVGAADVRSGGTTPTYNVTADAVIKGTPGRCVRVTVNVVTATAAITLNDCATTGAAAAGNTFFTIPTAAAVGTIYNLDWPCNTGIVAKFGTATGTLAFAFD